ncbi:MAG: type II toxin-antitoxin system RelE/ParE family toxin [Leptolyngbya sp. SIOISBB]|nr:type II toxin-antitoxin system RelE/ParE family toxin [Leptolyngbya sp. SIOISBB]
MTYSLIIPKSVQKQLDKLPDIAFKRVIKKLQALSAEPLPVGAIKLKGKENEYRIRVGDYRIRYKVDAEQQRIIISRCQHRKDVYR